MKLTGTLYFKGEWYLNCCEIYIPLNIEVIRGNRDWEPKPNMVGAMATGVIKKGKVVDIDICEI